MYNVYNAPALCGYVHTIRSGRIALKMNRIMHESLLEVSYGAEHCRMLKRQPTDFLPSETVKVTLVPLPSSAYE